MASTGSCPAYSNVLMSILGAGYASWKGDSLWYALQAHLRHNAGSFFIFAATLGLLAVCSQAVGITMGAGELGNSVLRLFYWCQQLDLCSLLGGGVSGVITVQSALTWSGLSTDASGLSMCAVCLHPCRS